MLRFGKPWAEHSPFRYNRTTAAHAALDEARELDVELLENEEISKWRHQLIAAGAGLISAGPLGLIASVVAFRRLKGEWLPWALLGVLAAPPLIYGQWQVLNLARGTSSSDATSSGSSSAAASMISQADQVARACALALRNGQNEQVMRNPLDGRPLSCDRTYPSTVVITSRSFAPLQTPQNCGGTSLAAGTRAAQWLVSPAGTLVCQAVAQSTRQWWQPSLLNRQQLYRRCTENLQLEAKTGFQRSAHQLGRRDYCAEERALLARDQIQNAAP